MVSIPYATVPGMDTKSHIYHKAAAIENGQLASSSNKCARTEPPFINGLADIQRHQGTVISQIFT